MTKISLTTIDESAGDSKVVVDIGVGDATSKERLGSGKQATSTAHDSVFVVTCSISIAAVTSTSILSQEDEHPRSPLMMIQCLT